MKRPKKVNSPILDTYDSSLPSPIQMLPDEVFIKIFSYLSLKEKFKCGKVCRLFRFLTLDPYLYREITIQPSPRENQVFELLLSRFSESIITLNLNFCTSIPPQSLTKISTCKSLKHLDLSHISDIPSSIFENHSIYESVHLVGSSFKDLNSLVRLCQNNLGLKSLSLDDIKLDGSILVSLCKNLKNLTFLSIGGIQVPNNSIIEAISSLDQLKVLKIRRCSTLVSFPRDFWGKFQNLIEVDLGYLNLSKEELSKIGDIFTLEKLDLSSIPLVTDDLITYYSTKLTFLQNLNLTSCSNISSPLIMNSGFPNLKVLTLYSCHKITPEFMKSLASLAHLEDLDLSYTPFLDSHMDHLLVNHSRIKVLQLRGTKITDISLDLLSSRAKQIEELNFGLCQTVYFIFIFYFFL